MPLRKAHRRDLPRIASTYAAAFWDEEVMGKLIHPYRQEHPQDFLRYWRHEVAEWYWSYSHQIMVSYETRQTRDGDEEQVLTGVADWIRHGEGWERLWGIWASWDPRKSFSPPLGKFDLDTKEETFPRGSLRCETAYSVSSTPIALLIQPWRT